jgi:hypothetical protein
MGIITLRDLYFGGLSMSNIEWFTAGDDYTFRYKHFVFRLHKQIITFKKHGQADKDIATFELQIRKIENTRFEKLGYIFFTYELGYDCFEFKKNSVKGIVWKEDDHLFNECEEILYSLDYIDLKRGVEKTV